MAAFYLSLAIAVRAEPMAATALVKDCLARAGALITSAERLGNQALVFGFEIAAPALGQLQRELATLAPLLDESAAKLNDAAETRAASDEAICSLHVTLVHSAPDERVERPKVPG